jgi:hypothetical protein
VADRHEGFDQVLAVWSGSEDLANLDALVTPDSSGSSAHAAVISHD